MTTANAVAKNYGLLSPEERFRLIMAASGRGDEAERDRLARSGERLVLSLAGHAPYAEALTELTLLTYIELLDEATRYNDAFDRLDDVRDDDEAEPADEDDDESHGDPTDTDAEPEEDDDRPPTASERLLEIAFACGYILRTKVDGWKLFCERFDISPHQVWETLPGFKRLQRALALTEKAAFVPEGMLRWLNNVRPDEQPELTEVPLTAERAADANEKMFRERVEWWSGAGK